MKTIFIYVLPTMINISNAFVNKINSPRLWDSGK